MLLLLRTFSKYSFNGKMVGFLIERRKNYGYQLWVCQFELLLLEKVLLAPLFFTGLCESVQMEGMHLDSYGTVPVEEHLCPDCSGPASKSNNVEVDLRLSTEQVSKSISGLFSIFF